MFGLQPPRHISTLPRASDWARLQYFRFAPNCRHERGHRFSSFRASSGISGAVATRLPGDARVIAPESR